MFLIAVHFVLFFVHPVKLSSYSDSWKSIIIIIIIIVVIAVVVIIIIVIIIINIIIVVVVDIYCALKKNH